MNKDEQMALLGLMAGLVGALRASTETMGPGGQLDHNRLLLSVFDGEQRALPICVKSAAVAEGRAGATLGPFVTLQVPGATQGDTVVALIFKADPVDSY